jgi:hypothetical protein
LAEEEAARRTKFVGGKTTEGFIRSLSGVTKKPILPPGKLPRRKPRSPAKGRAAAKAGIRKAKIETGFFKTLAKIARPRDKFLAKLNLRRK